MEEENKNINEPQSWGVKPTTVNLPADLYLLAKQNGISFKEAMVFGIQCILVEKDGINYPEGKQTQKIEKLSEIIQNLHNEINKLRGEVVDEAMEKPTPEIIDEEIDNVFGGVVDENAKGD